MDGIIAWIKYAESLQEQNIESQLEASKFRALWDKTLGENAKYKNETHVLLAKFQILNEYTDELMNDNAALHERSEEQSLELASAHQKIKLLENAYKKDVSALVTETSKFRLIEMERELAEYRKHVGDIEYNADGSVSFSASLWRVEVLKEEPPHTNLLESDFYNEVAEFKEEYGYDMLPKNWRRMSNHSKQEALDYELDVFQEGFDNSSDDEWVDEYNMDDPSHVEYRINSNYRGDL